MSLSQGQRVKWDEFLWSQIQGFKKKVPRDRRGSHEWNSRAWPTLLPGVGLGQQHSLPDPNPSSSSQGSSEQRTYATAARSGCVCWPLWKMASGRKTGVCLAFPSGPVTVIQKQTASEALTGFSQPRRPLIFSLGFPAASLECVCPCACFLWKGHDSFGTFPKVEVCEPLGSTGSCRESTSVILDCFS